MKPKFYATDFIKLIENNNAQVETRMFLEDNRCVEYHLNGKRHRVVHSKNMNSLKDLYKGKFVTILHYDLFQRLYRLGVHINYGKNEFRKATLTKRNLLSFDDKDGAYTCTYENFLFICACIAKEYSELPERMQKKLQSYYDGVLHTDISQDDYSDNYAYYTSIMDNPITSSIIEQYPFIDVYEKKNGTTVPSNMNNSDIDHVSGVVSTIHYNRFNTRIPNSSRTFNNTATDTNRCFILAKKTPVIHDHRIHNHLKLYSLDLKYENCLLCPTYYSRAYKLDGIGWEINNYIKGKSVCTRLKTLVDLFGNDLSMDDIHLMSGVFRGEYKGYKKIKRLINNRTICDHIDSVYSQLEYSISKNKESEDNINRYL